MNAEVVAWVNDRGILMCAKCAPEQLELEVLLNGNAFWTIYNSAKCWKSDRCDVCKKKLGEKR